MSGVDVLVVGAGAAGVAASLVLRRVGLKVVTLEAKDRIGGRCVTDRIGPGLPWDRGAHWLHDAERNPLRAYADRIGARYSRRPRKVLHHRHDGFAEPAWTAEVQAYAERAFRAVDDAGRRGEDRPASEVVPDHPRFKAMFWSLFAAFNGVEPDRMSTLDHARSRDGANWPVMDGYGQLLADLASGLPVCRSTPVRRIDHRGRTLRIQVPNGTLDARAVLVTVSTTALLGGALTFDPPLPPGHLEALDALPLGGANKVALVFTRNVFGRDDHHFLAFEHGTLEAARFDVRPAGRDLAIAYFGGRFAAEIEAAGERTMRSFALEKLTSAYGSGVGRHLRDAMATAWCGDPDIRGGYSCARPGCADARRTLSVPVGRIHFAGEAASIGAYGTVHGAWQSGERAAARIMQELGVEARMTPFDQD
ncbi:MAG: NAD(P)/FAD-dependent oxidoreductase [Geminicoccaceae bacterium]|nr:NAD(P)/FAD-dependent oxidoreductase [Geminicoccaceae bacterium]